MLRIVVFILGLLLACAGIGPEGQPEVVANLWQIAAGLATMACSSYAMLIAYEEQRHW